MIRNAFTSMVEDARWQITWVLRILDDLSSGSLLVKAAAGKEDLEPMLATKRYKFSKIGSVKRSELDPRYHLLPLTRAQAVLVNLFVKTP
jgi:hypothetical protein